MSNPAFDDMAAALDGHQVTDEQGQIPDETDTSVETPAAPEAQTTVDETATPEKAPEVKQPAPAETEDDENQLAEDETGKRYVPKSRFDKIYGKMKDFERKLAESPDQGLQPTLPSKTKTSQTDKTVALEMELLRATLPQFNRDSDQYDEELDQLGAEIYNANKDKGMTMIEAGRRAISLGKKLAAKVQGISQEARMVKSVQSDQGIAGRSISRGATQINPDNMSDTEIEAYLRKTGQW